MTIGRGWMASAVALALVGIIHAQPRRAPKEPNKLPAAQPHANGLPTGAVARFGQTRLRHADKPTVLTFTPDSKTLITGGDDGTVRVWSVATGDQRNILQKPGQRVIGLRFTHGGKRLAARFGSDGLVRFLDAATLRETNSVAAVGAFRFAFSTDGKLMFVSDFNGNGVVTETANKLPKLELSGANRFDFRPDSKAIAVGDHKGNVTVHLVTGGKPIFKLKLNDAVTGIAYSSNGERLAVGTRATDGTATIRVYEAAKQQPVAEIAGMSVPKAWIGADSLACGNGSEAGVYNLTKKAWEGRIKGVEGEFAVSPDGTKLAATGTGLRVRMWDLTTGKQLHAENDRFPDPVLMVGSDDGRTLFLITADNAHLWPVGAGSAKPAGVLPGRALLATFSGGTLVVATADALIVYANFDPSKPLPAKPTHTFKDSAGTKAVAVSATGSRIAWAVSGGKIFVADSADKDARRELSVTTTTVLALGFSPNGKRLGVLGRDPFLRVWDVSEERDEPKEVWKARIPRGQKGVVAFSPDGKFVVAVSTAQLAVFDAVDGKDVNEYREPLYRTERTSEDGVIQHAAFTPDSRLLVVGSVGVYGRIEVWELATRGLVRAFNSGYGGPTRLCLFAAGNRIASAGLEDAVTVWDISFRAGQSSPTADELKAALTALRSPKAAVGYPAVKVFAAAGDRGAETLAAALKDILTNEKKIVGVTTPDAGLFGDTLFKFRAVDALEEIGTAEAKTVLATIAASGGKAGDEANAALARLKQR